MEIFHDGNSVSSMPIDDSLSSLAANSLKLSTVTLQDVICLKSPKLSSINGLCSSSHTVTFPSVFKVSINLLACS